MPVTPAVLDFVILLGILSPFPHLLKYLAYAYPIAIKPAQRHYCTYPVVPGRWVTKWLDESWACPSGVIPNVFQLPKYIREKIVIPQLKLSATIWAKFSDESKTGYWDPSIMHVVNVSLTNSPAFPPVSFQPLVIAHTSKTVKDLYGEASLRQSPKKPTTTAAAAQNPPQQPLSSPTAGAAQSPAMVMAPVPFPNPDNLCPTNACTHCILAMPVCVGTACACLSLCTHLTTYFRTSYQKYLYA